jgi:hypothetical protein
MLHPYLKWVVTLKSVIMIIDLHPRLLHLFTTAHEMWTVGSAKWPLLLLLMMTTTPKMCEEAA